MMNLLASSCRTLAFAALLAVLAGAAYYAGFFTPENPSNTSSQGASHAAEDQANTEIALRSAYLTAPIGKVHRIFLKWQPDGTGQLLLDETTCTLTHLGVETPAQPHGKEIPVQFIKVPGGPRRGPNADSVFEIEGVKDGHFRIVKAREHVPSYRLLVLDKNKVTRVVTLEPWSL
jgi:hypothetical protein